MSLSCGEGPTHLLVPSSNEHLHRVAKVHEVHGCQRIQEEQPRRCRSATDATQQLGLKPSRESAPCRIWSCLADGLPAKNGSVAGFAFAPLTGLVNPGDERGDSGGCPGPAGRLPPQDVRASFQGASAETRLSSSGAGLSSVAALWRERAGVGGRRGQDRGQGGAARRAKRASSAAGPAPEAAICGSPPPEIALAAPPPPRARRASAALFLARAGPAEGGREGGGAALTSREAPSHEMPPTRARLDTVRRRRGSRPGAGNPAQGGRLRSGRGQRDGSPAPRSSEPRRGRREGPESSAGGGPPAAKEPSGAEPGEEPPGAAGEAGRGRSTGGGGLWTEALDGQGFCTPQWAP
ncbi:uncharacterized protein LOC143828344 [Paroedura picta]|uniref:uncharacterized protein LOC143828344 n=1 Tax=Paroedura picta TaxID=143630 RepID=UPI00405603CB